MQFSYLIHNGFKDNKDFLNIISLFQEFINIGNNYLKEDTVSLVLEKRPEILFIIANDFVDIDILLELKIYSDSLPYVVVVGETIELAYHSIKRDVNDFILFPVTEAEIRKCLSKFIKNAKKERQEKIIIKSNNDYNFIKIEEILYLKADNNTTDFFLTNGKKITAFKTLKRFEELLPFTFLRIHNSYIVNINYVVRINIGKSKCYLESCIIPFSRSYRENIDIIISRIS